MKKPSLLWERARAALVRYAPTERQRVFAFTISTGGICGLAAVGFHLAIKLAEHQMIDRAFAAPNHSWIFWVIATPTLGGLIAGIFLTYLVPNAAGSGIPQVKTAYALGSERLAFRDAVGKFFLSILQIGSGASLGREGPTVQICAGITNKIARNLPISQKSTHRMMPVAAAAGIAAAFNAPISAIIFTVEEIVGDMDQTLLTGVVVAAAIAAAVERSILGQHPVLHVAVTYGLQHASQLLAYGLLGVVAAGVSTLYRESLLRLRVVFKGWRVVPAWIHPAIGGAVTGVIAVAAMLGFKTGGINGGGYDVLSAALAGSLTLKVMLALCFLKIAATVFSYASGGAGGIFAPALFVGAMLGGVFGHLDRAIFQHSSESIGAFALVGMGAVFAGLIRAPITSILIIFEMTGNYDLILPLMISNMLAYTISHHWYPMPLYDALLLQDGVVLPHAAERRETSANEAPAVG